LATTWARKGKRPVFRRVTSDRRALSTAVALTLSGRIYKRHFHGSIKSEQIIEALQHLQRHVPGKIILIWDRARIHTSKKARTYLSDHPEIEVEFLPAYSPELNPEEYCHGNVKQGLKNARPTCKSEMRSLLNRGFARLRHRPDLLLSFFHRAGLSVRKLRLT
jgi:transposase